MNDFTLHPALGTPTHFVADWPLCRVLLMEEARYPWLLLVPRRAGIVELTDLSVADRALLIAEADRACRAVQEMPGVTKLNIGALGNITPQFHFHVIGRNPSDPAWPKPVWGHSAHEPYDPQVRTARLAMLRFR